MIKFKIIETTVVLYGEIASGPDMSNKTVYRPNADNIRVINQVICQKNCGFRETRVLSNAVGIVYILEARFQAATDRADLLSGQLEISTIGSCGPHFHH